MNFGRSHHFLAFIVSLLATAGSTAVTPVHSQQLQMRDWQLWDGNQKLNLSTNIYFDLGTSLSSVEIAETQGLIIVALEAIESQISNQLNIYRLEDGRFFGGLLPTNSTQRVEYMALSPDKVFLAAAFDDGSLRIWDI